MATNPPNPQASAPPQQGAAPAPNPGNPLQATLGKIIQLLGQISQQNVSIQMPVHQAMLNLAKAIQMSEQAKTEPPRQPQAPPQG